MSDSISVGTTVAASPARAWQAYTSPTEITRWNYASDDWCCPHAEVDLREGGAHRARMEAKDGSIGFDFSATYTEVQPEHALTLVLEDGRQSRTTFEAVEGGTRVTTTFDPEAEHSRQMQQDGWQAILDNFARYLGS